MKRKIIITKGLSGSGKTHYAIEYATKIPRTTIVCKDDIRASMGAIVGDKSTRVKESKVIEKRNELITQVLETDMNLIVCDTNLNPVHIKDIKALVYPNEVEIKDFTDVPVELCIERCANRPEGKDFWKKVIMQQKNEWLPLPIIEQDKSLPHIIISDHDGTIAHMCDRSPYSGVGSENDTPNEIVCEYLKAMHEKGYKICVLSGLGDDYYPNRENWLKANGIPYDFLYMRKAGDYRKDSVIKDELFEEHIKDKYYVHAIIDDRPQMIRYWQNKGYSRHLFAVGNPYKEF